MNDTKINLNSYNQYAEGIYLIFGQSLSKTDYHYQNKS